jgi:hypothetical protein
MTNLEKIFIINKYIEGIDVEIGFLNSYSREEEIVEDKLSIQDQLNDRYRKKEALLQIIDELS